MKNLHELQTKMFCFCGSRNWRCGRGGDSRPFKSIDQEVFVSERLFLEKRNEVGGRGEAGRVALV